MSVDEEPLNVRETARRLGVHENTVRNWARQGVLTAARLPGSRFLRFLPSDVERLMKQRAERTPSLQSERRATNPEFVTANQLDQWPSSRSRDAQENFPGLIRRLLVETPGITNISIRSGDGVALGGFDGLADSDGTSFLPSGRLAFEFGVDGRPKGKATSDYEKRVSRASSSMVFVFATPRRWAGGSAWADERRAERRFADVKVLDADDLEGWLNATPGALFWISEHLGLRPRDAVSLDKWWERFCGSTNPPLPIELFLAGRRTQARQLIERLTQASTLTVIQSEWADDALAFVHAALSSYQQPYAGAVVVVSSAEAWGSILENPGQAVLIPMFENPDVGRALDKGHHVITVIDRGATSRRPADLILPRVGRNEAVEAFQGVGVDFSRAQRLAVLGRQSMPALRRDLSLDPKMQRPDWANPPNGRILGALLLAGAWTSDPNDIEMLEAITNERWQVIEPLLKRVSASTDPLIRETTGRWSFVSPVESFLLLRDSITTETLQRSVAVSKQVLSEAGPVLDLPPEDRATAGIHGVHRRFSSMLREGLAQGLALLGAMGSTIALDNGATATDLAQLTVRDLLVDASADKTGRLWHQLASVLPLLAEAAPSGFIETLEDDLLQSLPVILKLFVEDSGTGLTLGPSSPHPYLLWALETVCWSSDYLADGVRVLARLASVEPGGRSGNRPLASLNSILCGWVRHTSASLDERLRALDVTYRIADEIGWKLNFELWPNSGGLVFPPAEPRFRDWRPTETAVPMSEWISFTHSLVDRAIDHADGDGDRLGQLADRMSSVSPNDQERILATLAERTYRGTLDHEARLVLWEHLRSLTAHHSQFSDADWALPADVRGRLSEMAEALEPKSEPERSAYLFDWHPDLPEVDRGDFHSYRTKLHQLRSDALHYVVGSERDVDRLPPLVRRVPSPTQLGWSLAELDGVEFRDLLPWLSSGDAALAEAGSAWLQRKVQRSGPEWFRNALLTPGLEGATREFLVRNAPAARAYWDVLRESAFAEDAQFYWRTAAFDVVPRQDVDEAVHELVSIGRAWAAIDVISHAVNETESRREGYEEEADIPPDMVVAVLDAALRHPPRDGELSRTTKYAVGELLDHLGKKDVPDTTIARFEYYFYRLLEHHRSPTALNHVLATSPEIFVDLVKRAFRGRAELRGEMSEAEQGEARQALWVLHQWKSFPGRGDDGTLDQKAMINWVKAARLLLAEANRSDIGDEVIGQAFAWSPPGDDGVWPAEPVRELLEAIGSRDLENGLLIGRMNTQGATWRGVYDGGQQERDLVKRYRDWCAATRADWPRTARILRELADSYEREARRQDATAELHADRG